MISDRTAYALKGMLYIVQFDRDPCDAIPRILELASERKAIDASPEELLQAIEEGLAAGEEFADLIPQPHSEAEVRRLFFAMAEAVRVHTTRS